MKREQGTRKIGKKGDSKGDRVGNYRKEEKQRTKDGGQKKRQRAER
jgi:hypothetical protein